MSKAKRSVIFVMIYSKFSIIYLYYRQKLKSIGLSMMCRRPGTLTHSALKLHNGLFPTSKLEVQLCLQG